MTRTARRLAARLLAVVILVSASLGSVTLSSAAPTQEDVRRAKERLDALNRDLSLLVERYNQARIRLNDVQVRLTEVRLEAERAQAVAERAIGSLNRSAARAFTGFGSQFTVLLDATSLGDFSDRLEFIGNMAQADADLATQAELARQEARWTADELRAAVEQRREVLDELAAQKEQIDARVDEARELYAELDRRYHEALAAARAAAAAAQQQSTGGGSVAGGSVDVSPIPPPPAPNGNVAAVLDAAYSVIGTPYQWGGSSPETGFDCSGFTMWSWAHAGVSLPHSSAAQYSSLPHVAREDLQAGDLLFFYSPISHVGMYVGGGRMIHSSHPGTTVSVVSVYWDSFSGAARPG
jgi:cell wall-associated NlpC family hydrolase